jgi:SnoaL-like domain
MIVGYLSVDFHCGERRVTPAHLTVVLVNGPTGWRIAHYHVSLIP